jgi:Rho family protein
MFDADLAEYLALKCDLRDDPLVKEKLAKQSLKTITYDEGLAVARTIRASRYLGMSSSALATMVDHTECSAKHNRGVQEAIVRVKGVA